MSTWIALFRGINVGGSHILPMARLRSDLESLGCTKVRTYIQSGNAVFDSRSRSPGALAKKIGARIAEQHGFRPHVLILDPDGLRDAISANPFPQAVGDPKSLHFAFLAEPPSNPDRAALDVAQGATEKYVLTEQVFYLHAPDGIARSKLAVGAEKHLGVITTSRNYRTVDRLQSMLDD